MKTHGKAPDLMKIVEMTIEGRDALASGDGPRAYEILSSKHEGVLAVFGTDSGPTGTSLVDLAEALHLLGRKKEARDALDRALTIFRSLDRRDEMRERLEASLIEICRQQGHAFAVEEVLRARISEGRGESSEEELTRAIDQDNLASSYFRQGQYDKALLLLLDSKSIFERAGEHAKRDLSVCCQFISRVYLHTDRYDEAVTYGREAVASACDALGKSSLEATMASDELAVSIAFCARRDQDPALARESIALSSAALERFTALQGPSGKEAMRSGENNRRLRNMLAPLLVRAEVEAVSSAAPPAAALPTYSFISHAYADGECLALLLRSLPEYVKPVVFEAIVVPPTEIVGEKLISGVLDADGFIFIDSVVSRASPWCAFERDLAARKQKHMFRFDPQTHAFEPVHVEPRELKLAHCFHPDDDSDVDRVMQWLVEERSFAAFDGRRLQGAAFTPFAALADEERELRLFSLRTFGTLYLIFLSDAVIADEGLRRHAVVQMSEHQRATVVCWLHAPPPDLPDDLQRAFAAMPPEHRIAFGRRPSDDDFNRHSLDDLAVRLFWAHHNIREGDWSL